jgi:hypothetical protein
LLYVTSWGVILSEAKDLQFQEFRNLQILRRPDRSGWASSE